MIKTLYLNAPRMMEVSLLLLAVWWSFSMWQSNSEIEQPSALMVENKTEKAALVSLKSLTAVPLFGKLEVSVVEKKQPTPKPVASSRLNIKLLGTVVAGERSAAIMTVGTSAETTFFLGDPLYGRVFLKEVKADAVILSNQGNDERVIMSEGKAMAGARVINPPTVYEEAAASPMMATPQRFPPGMPMGQGLPPGMQMNQGLPQGVQMNQGLPPGVQMNQGLPPGMQMNQGLPPGMQMGQGLPPGMQMGQGLTPGSSSLR